MIWWTILIVAFISWANAAWAKSRGYFFWRTFFFTMILCIVVMAILHTNGFRVL